MKKHLLLGDILHVDFLNYSFDLPYVDTFTSAAISSPLVLICSNKLVMTANMRNFVTVYGLVDEEGKWKQESIDVKYTLVEKGGYLDEIEARNLSYSSVRSDFSHLTDAQYANFREVNTTNIAPKRLYRGASPIDNMFNRRDYVLKMLALPRSSI